jgi:ribosome-binding factor A
MSRRNERVSKLILREISELLEREISDPRLSSLISVTGVSVSADLKYAKVFVSILGNETSKRDMLAGFNAASGFLRRELSSHLKLKCTPQLSFHYDNSIKEGARLLNLIEQVSKSNSMTKFLARS